MAKPLIVDESTFKSAMLKIIRSKPMTKAAVAKSKTKTDKGANSKV